ncbi:MAG: efflux RND transporter permease subunit [Spirochaetales bacterium]|nr:efflux RND transporter permease subunit [Spirochaetales bacterium]
MPSKNFHESRVRSRLLLIGLLAVSVIFISRGTFGGRGGDEGRMAVICRYYGLSPEVIEQTITLLMEESIAELPGIEELSASSEFSESRIDLKLSPSTNPDDFLLELRERVDRSYAFISKTSPAIQKPVIVTSGRQQNAVFSVSFSKDTESSLSLRPFIENEVKPSYARIGGLGEINVTGGAMLEVHVKVDPDRASTAGFGSSDIASIIQSANLYQSEGELDDGRMRIPVTMEARLKTLEAIRDLPIGRAMKLGSIADINYAWREPEDVSRLQGTERVSLHVKSSSPRLISISAQLRKETEKWEEKGFNADIIFDQGRELEKSFRRIAAALLLGMLLSGSSLVLFGTEGRRILLLSAGQPVLLITTLGLLSAAEIPFDHFLLAGIAIGTGMVLDCALLLTESINRRGHGGLREISPALISSTLSTLLALLPVFPLNREIPGILPLVLSLAIMLGLSLILSMVFIPAFYHPEPSLASSFRRPLLDRLKAGILRRSRRNPRLSLILYAAILSAGIICLASTPIKLDEVLKNPVIFAHLELAEGESLRSSDSKIRVLAEALGRGPGVEMVQSTSRRSGGDLSLRFNPDKIKREEVLKFMRAAGREVPGGFLYIPEGRGRDSLQLEVALTGPDQNRLKNIAREALGELLHHDWALEGVLHFKDDPPALYYLPDRKALSNAGLYPAEPAQFLRWNLQGPVADKWQADRRERDIRVMAEDSPFLSLDDLKALTIAGRGGTGLYRLDQLGSFIHTTETSRINRLNRQRSVSFTAVCRKSDPARLNELIWAELDKLPLPPGYAFIPSARLMEKQEFYRKLWRRFALTVVLIFFLLSIERESLSQAGIILLPLPLILAFPVIILRISGQSIGSEAILGLILLSGMGINNGILILDRLPPKSSGWIGIKSAVEDRFNGLFLTTVTTITGILPLLFTGEEFFIGLGTVIASGLIGSFLVSLFIFPGLLLIFRSKGRPSTSAPPASVSELPGGHPVLLFKSGMKPLN